MAVLRITDHRGSIVGAVESDAGGTTLLAGADYTPMGRVASQDPTDDDAETCREEGNPGTRCVHPGGMPFGFAGAWRSEATGLVYMRFRWYSPTLAQFLTPDPMGEVDSWNLYAYVGGDLIDRWDPWGLDASSWANGALEGKAPVDPSNTGAPVDHGGEPPRPEQSGHSMMPGVGSGHGGPRPPRGMPPPEPRSFPGPDVPRPPMTEPIPLRPVPIAEPPTTSSPVRWCFASPVNLLVCLAALIPASEPIVDPPADVVPLEAGPAGPESGAGGSAEAPEPWLGNPRGPGTSGGPRAGKPFTRKGKAEIDATNAQRHGKPVCENCGVDVVPGQKSQKGVTPPGNERHRDHELPRSKGGDGDPSNGEVLCRDCNLGKSDGP